MKLFYVKSIVSILLIGGIILTTTYSCKKEVPFQPNFKIDGINDTPFASDIPGMPSANDMIEVFADESIDFMDSSTGKDAERAKMRKWDFGDGTTNSSLLKIVSHSYSEDFVGDTLEVEMCIGELGCFVKYVKVVGEVEEVIEEDDELISDPYTGVDQEIEPVSGEGDSSIEYDSNPEPEIMPEPEDPAKQEEERKRKKANDYASQAKGNADNAAAVASSAAGYNVDDSYENKYPQLGSKIQAVKKIVEAVKNAADEASTAAQAAARAAQNGDVDAAKTAAEKARSAYEDANKKSREAKNANQEVMSALQAINKDAAKEAAEKAEKERMAALRKEASTLTQQAERQATKTQQYKVKADGFAKQANDLLKGINDTALKSAVEEVERLAQKAGAAAKNAAGTSETIKKTVAEIENTSIVSRAEQSINTARSAMSKLDGYVADAERYVSDAQQALTKAEKAHQGAKEDKKNNSIGNSTAFTGARALNSSQVSSCTDYSLGTASISLTPQKAMALMSGTVYSSGCGSLTIKLSGPSVNISETFELSQGKNQLVFTNLVDSDLASGQTYTLSLQTGTSNNCSSSSPELLNANSCGVNGKGDEQLSVSYNGQVCLFKIKYLY